MIVSRLEPPDLYALIDVLLDYGSDLTTTANFGGITPLISANGGSMKLYYATNKI